MKKTVKPIALFLSLTILLTACGGGMSAPPSSAAPESSAAPSAATTEASYVMNIGNVGGTDHPINQALRDFKAKVEARTNGDVQVDIYDNSVLGGELELLEQVIVGTLESAVIMGGSNWESYDLAADIALLPFLFGTLEGARKAWNGSFGEKFTKEIVEPNGAYCLSYWESGFRHMTNNVRPVIEPEDMQGIKFRTSQNDMKIQMFNALNSSVIMIPFGELFTALQQGTVQGQENPLSNIYASSLQEVQTYLSLTGHMYDICAFIVNPAWLDALPADYQAIIREEAAAARELELAYNDEAILLEKLQQEGMQVNEVNTAAFVEKMKPIWDNFAEHIGQEWIDAALEAQK